MIQNDVERNPAEARDSTVSLTRNLAWDHGDPKRSRGETPRGGVMRQELTRLVCFDAGSLKSQTSQEENSGLGSSTRSAQRTGSVVSPLCERVRAGISPSGTARWESPVCGDSAQRPVHQKRQHSGHLQTPTHTACQPDARSHSLSLSLTRFLTLSLSLSLPFSLSLSLSLSLFLSLSIS